mmetsp:Transcript_33135/g.32263  ORF Transcript_33135/g.32263 Transcript_33135/m.32263 type:complete len:182 (+) Transcript_33135:93-638(+)|eukprot:CAMPEP_0170554730 /NCGR_PEP_ID=MMETSP0211-20121228/12608_1 /TAXON_ID=311385 /ORGANISM="Pseudokeronopsis sp., Strain OXSARD2" /LENGTH=181 /DNA_ID=CAMNT_0010864035 /DNA_START=90 /DNA_END=635 /DNA_ORIENTATION=+
MEEERKKDESGENDKEEEKEVEKAFRKIDLNDFPHYKRKLVIQNIPIDQSREEIMNYFYTILSQYSKEQYNKNPIMSVNRYSELGNFVTLDFRKREEADICLNLDGTEYKSGFKMRIQRVKRFIEEWNKEVEKGGNPNNQKGSHFHDEDKNQEKKVDKTIFEDNLVDSRIYMGNIPAAMTD